MYTLLSAYAEPDYFYDHPWTRKDNNGNALEQHLGHVIKFTAIGKWKDPTRDEPVYGTVNRIDGISAHWKMREGRALGKLELADEAERMVLKGYKDVTEESLLQWFLKHHGSQRGVEWNVYDEHGRLVPEEDLTKTPRERELSAIARGDRGAFTATDVDGVGTDDSYFILSPEQSDKDKWECLACKVEMGTGMTGHRRGKKHWENVDKALAQRQQAVAV